MAIANFFDKSALAASQVLKGFDDTTFRKTLENTVIELAFDNVAITTSEGKATLDLCIRILSRLYPRIILSSLDDISNDYKESLSIIAKNINPKIEIIQDGVPNVSMVIGKTSINRTCPVLYIGSNNWLVHHSVKQPVLSGNSNNPFGAGAAACIGAANIFRYIFSGQLDHGDLDADFTLSLVDFNKDNGLNPEFPDSINIDDAVLVGLGAIGHGVMWALSNCSKIRGNLTVVDSERLDLSNLQRYVLAIQTNVNDHKSKLASQILENSSLNVNAHEGDWASYLSKRDNWLLPIVMVAVDTAKDRIAIQSSLPGEIINAWTQPYDLGVSRHFQFIQQPCLACLYPHKNGIKSDSMLIAEALGMADKERELRDSIYNNSPVNRELLEKIAIARNIDISKITDFENLPIREFYSKVICGGVILGTETNNHNETPMAFQSAFAGILLASELILRKHEIRTTAMETITRFNLLRPIANYLNDPISKSAYAKCICHDNDFRNQYELKYLK